MKGLWSLDMGAARQQPLGLFREAGQPPPAQPRGVLGPNKAMVILPEHSTSPVQVQVQARVHETRMKTRERGIVREVGNSLVHPTPRALEL